MIKSVLGAAGLSAMFSVLIASVAGYINNVLWLFANGVDNWSGEGIISVAGLFVPPLGVFHGIWLWFQ